MIYESNFTFAQGFADDGYAPQLERDYCSNFVCCGFALADMHDLVRHFEERHVTVDLPPPSPGTINDPISPETASSSAVESPRSTYTATPPPPDLFPTLTAPFIPRESAFSPIHVSASSYIDSNYQNGAYIPSSFGTYVSKDSFNTGLYSECHDPVPRSDMDTLSPSRAQICLPPSHLIAHTHPPPLKAATALDSQAYPDPPANVITPHSYPPTIAPIPIYARHPNLSIITDLPLEPAKPAKKRKLENNTSWTAESDGDDTQHPPPRRKKLAVNKQPVREKAFKCSHTGCIKSYMNLNGLKYHLTKGACEYAAP